MPRRPVPPEQPTSPVATAPFARSRSIASKARCLPLPMIQPPLRWPGAARGSGSPSIPYLPGPTYVRRGPCKRLLARRSRNATRSRGPSADNRRRSLVSFGGLFRAHWVRAEGGLTHEGSISPRAAGLRGRGRSPDSRFGIRRSPVRARLAPSENVLLTRDFLDPKRWTLAFRVPSSVPKRFSRRGIVGAAASSRCLPCTDPVRHQRGPAAPARLSWKWQAQQWAGLLADGLYPSAPAQLAKANAEPSRRQPANHQERRPVGSKGLFDRDAADMCERKPHHWKISVVQSPPWSLTSCARAGPSGRSLKSTKKSGSTRMPPVGSQSTLSSHERSSG